MNDRPSFLRRLRNSLRVYVRGRLHTLDLVPDGFVYTEHGKPVQVLWHDVRQIEAGVCDYLIIDVFFAVIHTAGATVTIDELVDGFRQLECGILERWPQVRERWLALQNTEQHQPALEVLWRRQA